MSALRIGKGVENSYCYEANKSATERWLEKLVAQGKVPQSALDAVQQRSAGSRLETTVINSRPAAEIIPEYKKGRIPGEPANLLSTVKLRIMHLTGTKI